MKIRAEEMRFRQRLCEYALKYGVTRVTRRYKTSPNFKSPNEIVSEYFSKCNICLDN